MARAGRRHRFDLRQRRPNCRKPTTTAAYTTRLTPASRAATRTFSDASMLARFEVTGSCTERGTDGIAA
jgi:hypothetical protein